VNEPEQAQTGRGHAPIAELRLRSERPPVMRLSRKVLTSLMGIAAITVSGALIWALYQGNKKSGGGPELYNTETKTTPEGLSTLPRDYAGVPQNNLAASGIPQLGPPLPGDIGRPVASPQSPGPEQSIPNSSASRRKPKLPGPAACSPPPARGSGPRRRPRRFRRRIKRQRQQPDKQMRLQSIPSRFSTCRTASRPS